MSRPLLDLLTQEVSAVGEYIELLDQEANALSDSNFANLPVLAERKSTLADHISGLGRRRDQEQLALGYPAGRAGTEAACAGAGPALAQAWADLLTCATLASSRNQRNGVMIHIHLDFTRQTISFLQNSGHPLYGPDGGHRPGTGGGSRLARG